MSYPFGFGLSYARIDVKNIRVERSGFGVDFLADVSNKSEFRHQGVIQLYTGYENSAVERHVKDLRDFRRVYLEPGETKTVRLHLEAGDVDYYDQSNGRWVHEKYRLY